MKSDNNTRFIELRKKLGITQAEFAKRFGIPKRTIENWEQGKTRPTDYIINLLDIVINK